jgi:microcystin-dependent protein
MINELPTAAIVSFAGSTAPSGWVLCDGSSYDGTISTYTALWSVLQTTYGGGGQSSFRVPSLGGRVPVGVKASTSGSGIDGPIGSWGGATDVTLTSSMTGVKSHFHTVTDSGHTHTFTNSFSNHTHQLYWSTSNVATKNGNTGYGPVDGNNPYTAPTTYAGTSTVFNSGSLNGFSINENTAGSASSHSNSQPQLVVNYIIKL